MQAVIPKNILCFCLQPFSESCGSALDELNVVSKVTNKEFINTLKFFGKSPNTKAMDFFNFITCFLDNFEIVVHRVKPAFCCAFACEYILIFRNLNVGPLLRCMLLFHQFF